MNTNPNTNRVLCFGDSNTWGRSGGSKDRYPAYQRWTGQLQTLLGNSYEIIEEGLRSRTTNLDENNPDMPGRNGLKYLQPCLESHYPLNFVVLFLGTNDLQTKFNRNAQDVAKGVVKLIKSINKFGQTKNHQPPKIILVSPPIVKEEALKKGSKFIGAGEKSKQLGVELNRVSQEYGCLFLDLAKHVDPGDMDGVHVEVEDHEKIARLIYDRIKQA